MSAIDDLIQALEALKQKSDGTILYAAEVHNLVDGIFAAMEMGGTTDYVDLENKPQIGGVTLSGNKSAHDLGLATEGAVENLSNKVDKLPTGMFYGQYASVEDLEAVTSTVKGYAYVPTGETGIYYIYTSDGNDAAWVNSGNKFYASNLESNLATKSTTKAPTTEAVADGISEVDLMVEKATPLTGAQKYQASANINDRAADVVPVTNEVRALGYKVLNPALGFSEQVTTANTVYEIRDEFNLNNANVTIPANCTLKFNGGKIKNGTIVGNDTVIDASRTTIFDSNVIFSGTFVGEAYPEWVGNNINKCVNAFKCVKLAPNKTYQVTETIVMPWKSSIVGEKTTILNTSISPVIDMGYLTTLDNFIIKTNHTDNVINISTDNITKTYYSRGLHSARQININNIVISSTVQQWKKVFSSGILDTEQKKNNYVQSLKSNYGIKDEKIKIVHYPADGNTGEYWIVFHSFPSNPVNAVNGEILRFETDDLDGFEKDHYYKCVKTTVEGETQVSWDDITDVLSQYGIYEESSCIQILCDGWCPSQPNNLGVTGIADISIDNVNINGRWKYGVRIDNGTHAGINVTYLWITDIKIRKLWCYYVLNTFYITRDDKGGTGTNYPAKIYISNCSTQFDDSMEYFVLGERGSCVLDDCIPWDWTHEKYSIQQGAFNLKVNNSEDFSSGFTRAIKQTGTSDATPGFNYNMPEGAAIGNRTYGGITQYALSDVAVGAVAKVKNIRRLPYGVINIGLANKELINLKLSGKTYMGSNAGGYLIKASLYGEIGLALIMKGNPNYIIAFNVIPSTMSNEDDIPDWKFIPSILHMSSGADNVAGTELLRELNGKTITVLGNGTWHDALGHYFTTNQFVSDVSKLASIPSVQQEYDINGGKILLDKSTNKLYSYNNTTKTWYDAAGVEVAGLKLWKGTMANIPTPTLNKGIGSRFLITDLHRWITWFGNAWYYEDGTLPSEFIQVDQAVVNFTSPAADNIGKVVTVYIADGVVGSVISQYYSAFPTTVDAPNQIRIKTSANSSADTARSEIYIIKDEVVTQGENFPTTNLSDGQKFFKTLTSTIGGVEYPRFHFYEYSVDSVSWSDITSTFASDASKVKKIIAYKPGSVMTISPSSYEFPAEGGSQEFTATTYASSLSEVTIVPVDADWITMGTIANKKITLTAAENTGAARQVSVTFKDNAPKTTTIVITQKAGVATVEE